jgi:catechol 2,3-dioxygenase
MSIRRCVGASPYIQQHRENLRGAVMTMQAELSQRVRFRPRRLGHANLFVSDLERSMAFYTKVCGLEGVRREPEIKAGFMSNGNTHHDVGLVQVSAAARAGPGGQVRGRQAGLNHLGFEMENEVELVAAYQRARQAGMEIDRTIDHQISRSVYLFDPEGNGLEFYADATKDWRSIFRPDRFDLVSRPWTPGEPLPSAEHNYPVNPEIRRVEGAVCHPQRVTHASLVVRDFEACFRFYTEVAGLREVYYAPAGAFAILAGTCLGQDLALYRADEDRPMGLHHIGFEVAEERELDETEGRLREVGIKAELRIDHETKRSIFLRDPDGILLEFYVARSVPLSSVGTPIDVQVYLA